MHDKDHIMIVQIYMKVLHFYCACALDEMKLLKKLASVSCNFEPFIFLSPRADGYHLMQNEISYSMVYRTYIRVSQSYDARDGLNKREFRGASKRHTYNKHAILAFSDEPIEFRLGAQR